MKSILIIGMGKFGHHLCEELLELGNDVMAVDVNEERVADIIYKVTNVQIGDCSDPQVVKSLGIRNFDLVFVCIGADFQNSLEVTSLVKEMGAGYVVSKANRDVHARFLLKNGADEVIYPDRDIAAKVAKRFSMNHVFDYIELDDSHAIYEIPLKESWVGKSIQELNIRQTYGIMILGVRHGEETVVSPAADYRFKKGEHLIVLGLDEDLNRILKNM
ncbi:MAG: TrkA family potassium uptake protein [Muribaculaceae bacterium]|nr:TrkA family potassium uptake protein [Roseburia sp.]MCM1431712.1 TrkA family potassium uptake protein [Muribaculaceae bacterium]MCM1491616.1 TrkA family potassium uptake protein [Muribaculaceae bacterium]